MEPPPVNSNVSVPVPPVRFWKAEKLKPLTVPLFVPPIVQVLAVLALSNVLTPRVLPTAASMLAHALDKAVAVWVPRLTLTALPYGEKSSGPVAPSPLSVPDG